MALSSRTQSVECVKLYVPADCGSFKGGAVILNHLAAERSDEFDDKNVQYCPQKAFFEDPLWIIRNFDYCEKDTSRMRSDAD